MGSMNRVFLMGNLTRNPEMRQTPSGTPVVDLGLAVNETFKNKAGESVESVCFADIVVWGRQAEACQQYLAKGSAVMVEGKLQFEQWQTTEGQKRSKLKIRANRVQFLGRPRKEQATAPIGTPAPEAEVQLQPADVADDTPF
jgi:single-strand DNA-binding protein